MLPRDRKLTPEEIEAVRHRAAEFIGSRSLSYDEIARQLGSGFGSSTIYAFVHNNPRGDKEKAARALNAWMIKTSDSEGVSRPKEFVETTVARDILVAAKQAMDFGRMAVVIGPSGCGKTITFETLAATYPGTIYLRLIINARRPAGFHEMLAEALKLSKCPRSATRRQLDIIGRLKGTKRLLILDEFQIADEALVVAVRDLHDTTGIPIVLAGTEDLRAVVLDNSQWYGQFSSRVIATLNLNDRAGGPNAKKPLFRVRDVIKVFEQDKLRLTDDSMDFLAELACLSGLGGLRICREIVDAATRLPGFRNKRIEPSLLYQVLMEIHDQKYAAQVKFAEGRIKDTRDPLAAAAA